MVGNGLVSGLGLWVAAVAAGKEEILEQCFR